MVKLGIKLLPQQLLPSIELLYWGSGVSLGGTRKRSGTETDSLIQNSETKTLKLPLLQVQVSWACQWLSSIQMDDCDRCEVLCCGRCDRCPLCLILPSLVCYYLTWVLLLPYSLAFLDFVREQPLLAIFTLVWACYCPYLIQAVPEANPRTISSKRQKTRKYFCHR